MARNRIGQRLLFTSPDILGEVINAYFDECDEKNEPYTISGICLACGFNRDTFNRYGRVGPHVDVITQARLIIQKQLELQLHGPGRVTGPIFTLKQFGWSDRHDYNVQTRRIGNDEDENKWTVEFVEASPKAELDEVSDSDKVTPISRKAKAV